MRAVVLTGDAEITLVERPVPVAPPGGLLLRVDACGICGTDLHAPSMPQMSRTREAPWTDDTALTADQARFSTTHSFH